MLEDTTSEINITSIMIAEEAIEISFFEAKDQGSSAALVKTILLERKVCPQFEDILDDLRDLVDFGLLLIRNPSKTISPRNRIGSNE